ncbi:MAG TPA: 3-carboxy-cis,cis-muconate cycloisomerase [Candidatus Angelobacter sp.]|nr:3-carboxy-cis,cis-muconate cycloisomerase [Candidatus Angelobacter sp.]
MPLIDSLATTPALAALFSDRSLLQAMLDFEAALARVEAHAGLIPNDAANAITLSAQAGYFDADTIAHDTLRAGTPGIALAKALTERVRAVDPSAAGYVHWGATSQDVADTALVLVLKKAQTLVEADILRADKALRRLADEHAHTVMIGRTLLQGGPPITFGLKAAGWLGAIRRSQTRLSLAFDEALMLQFGGASGTLASLGDRGLEISTALAKELGLALPEAPWHTHRDRLASLVCACGVIAGSLGKIARDISLLMQEEIGEVAEPSTAGRGGSSTMPHKRNPIGCSLALAAAHRVPGMVASFLSAMIQEHERAAGGWQSEWPTVAAIIQATGVAAASMAEVLEGLTVNPERMKASIEATKGTIFAERAMMLLAPHLGRDVAHKLLEETVRKAIEQKRSLREVLGEMPEIRRLPDRAFLKNLDVPEEYLGVSDQFRTRLLGTQKRHSPEDTKE